MTLEVNDYRENPSSAKQPAQGHVSRDDPNTGGVVEAPYPDLSIHNVDVEKDDSWDTMSDFSKLPATVQRQRS